MSNSYPGYLREGHVVVIIDVDGLPHLLSLLLLLLAVGQPSVDPLPVHHGCWRGEELRGSLREGGKGSLALYLLFLPAGHTHFPRRLQRLHWPSYFRLHRLSDLSPGSELVRDAAWSIAAWSPEAGLQTGNRWKGGGLLLISTVRRRTNSLCLKKNIYISFCM